MRRFLKQISFTLLLSCSVTTTATAAVDAGKTSATTITVYLQETLDTNGNLQPTSKGLLKFFQFLERETGLHLQPVSVPWNRAKLMTLEGKGIIWGFSKSPERLLSYRYSQTVFSSRIWAIAYGEPHLHLRSISDLQGKVVSVERGVSHGMEFELAKNKVFRIDEDSAQASARFKKLIAKRSDVLLWGLAQFDRPDLFLTYLHKTYIPELADPELLGKTFYVSDKPLFYDSIHFASGKTHFEIEMQKIDAAIKRGFKTGELTRLVATLD
ncbi:substrate-binding periplasmic protein [Undibacterium sp.]|uniref:substrate-binding periplasmic protein n=1 Tax=Undibacterium sp. TaxID=1914977 RepID=UPI0037506F39